MQRLIIAVILLAGMVTLVKLDGIMAGQTDYKTLVLSNESVLRAESVEQAEKVAPRGDSVTNTAYSMPLSGEELDIVCRITMSEARGEPYQGMMAVAQVIRDRSLSWGKTVKEVALAPNQFASLYRGEITDECIMAVNAVFEEGESILEYPTTHFHADYVNPYWAKEKVNRGTISRHKFYGE